MTWPWTTPTWNTIVVNCFHLLLLEDKKIKEETYAKKKETNVKHFTFLEDKFICKSYLFLDMTFNLPSLEHNFDQNLFFCLSKLCNLFVNKALSRGLLLRLFWQTSFWGFMKSSKNKCTGCFIWLVLPQKVLRMPILFFKQVDKIIW